MNLFEGRNMAQFCNRCKGVMLGDTPRKVIDGKVYHIYCGWKLEQEAIRRIPDRLVDLGGDDADTLHQGGGSDATVLEQRDTNSTPDSPSDKQGQPRPLHWTSHQ